MGQWGLHHRGGSLPLLRVQAAATIKELAAQVTLIHTYENDGDWPLEATYTFPVPARAVVCKVSMIRGDGTRVDGVVREREEARETYDAALIQGQSAALMEQQTPDVFSIAMGNIHARETVQIELVYATSLTEDEENDSVRFHLPMSICQRFGYSPIPYSIFPASAAFLDIVVDLETVSPILHISSPTHNISLRLGPDPFLPNAAELPSSYYARVMLSSASSLDRDFILTMRSAGLDAPRCVAEIHPLQRTVALALSVVPRFKLPDIPRQEFIFLVDRSGSMRGPRIAALRRALVVMLRSLPAQGTLFQIASFGSRCTMLWEAGSRVYDQETLEQATAHVDGMQADYGGTQIRAALARCFGSRRTDRPTSVFLLTDGAAWDVGSVLEEVRTAVDGCPVDAYLRVSVLGIGSAAATDMCESIARVGNGTCVLVAEEETSFTGKIARMLKAARTPMMANITVDWGVGADPPDGVEDDDEFVVVSGEQDDHVDNGKAKEKMILSMFDETIDPLQLDLDPVPPPTPVTLPPLPRIQQSPFKLQTISPANRLNLYCIIQDKVIPKTVTLVGTTAEGSEIRLDVPVTLSNLPNALDSAPVLHALAARKIIQDMEDGRHALASSVPDDEDLLARTVHAAIARLGKMYSISSSQTSFVVVDESLSNHFEIPKGNLPPASGSRYPTSSVAIQHWDEAASKETQYLRRRCFKCRTMSPASWRRSTQNPGKIVCNKCGLYERTHLRARPLRIASHIDDRRPSLMPALHVTEGISREIGPIFASRRCSRQMRDGPESSRGINSSASQAQTPDMVSRADVVTSDTIEALARFQYFDGRFSDDVLSLVLLAVDADEARVRLDLVPWPEVFPTLIAMAYLRAKMGPRVEKESWEAIYGKARSFVETILSLPGRVEEMEEKAMGMLV